MPKERNAIKDCFKWKLEDIFSSDDAWEECYFSVEESMGKVSAYQDKLSDDKQLLECLNAVTKIHHDLSRLYQYAHMRRDQDTRVTKYQGMNDRAYQLSVRFSTITSYITPELVTFSDDKLKALMNDKKFEKYSLRFKNVLRNKAIILSKKEEKLLDEMGIFTSTPDEVFSMFDNADVKFKPVEVNGKEVEMSHGVYSVLMQNVDATVRKAAFESMFASFRDHINTLAANYAGNCKQDWFFAKIRGFNSSLAFSMYCEEVTPTCYEKLLEAVGKGTKNLHRYVALRRRILGENGQNMYDMYLPIVSATNLNLPYEKAVDTVKSALKVLGKEYSDVLATAFTDGWIDVYENKGKRSGAYSWGCYGVHPFVLLNHNDTVHDTFTIAHELGHSMHSYFSNATQCEQKADYEIFVAEIASTVNEVLLLKYLMKDATGDLKKYLLAYYLDMFRTTLFRQTQFAEFEEFAHKAAEQGQPLTADFLSDGYYALNKKYYGRAVKHNDLIRYEWARIPHFYSSFYVYKYATGLTAAVSIARNILDKGEEYFNSNYKKFLSAGGSLPPLDILRLANVDLETDKPYEDAMKEFASTLDELEKLMK